MKTITQILFFAVIFPGCLSKPENNNKRPLTLYFDLNEDTLNQSHFAVLDSVGQYLKDHTSAKLIIGYSTDDQEQNTIVDGEHIGMRRVTAAKQYLKDFWAYDPSFSIIEEHVHGKTLGDNSEKKLEPCGHDCRRVYFEFEH